jgi:hypothetical protein
MSRHRLRRAVRAAGHITLQLPLDLIGRSIECDMRIVGAVRRFEHDALV